MAWVYLMQGITSFRQTPGLADVELKVKEKIERGEIAGPRIFLGGSLWMSGAHWARHLSQNRQTDPAAIDFVKHHFEYNVIDDIKNLDPNGWGQEGPNFNFWKLYMWEEPFDGKNDFTDAELTYIIERAHKLGKVINVHCGGHNNEYWRMLAFDINTLEHPFYGNEIIDWDIIQGYVKKGVIVDSLLQVMIDATERADKESEPLRRNALHHVDGSGGVSPSHAVTGQDAVEFQSVPQRACVVDLSGGVGSLGTFF